MKNLILSAILLLSLSFLAQAQKKNSTITVVVDTENINQTNVAQMVTMYDDRSNPSPIGNVQNFTTDVDGAKSVRWIGKPKNPSSGHKVLITLIEQKTVNPGDEVLVYRSNPGNSGKVKAKVKNNVQINDIENYNIHFTIRKNGANYGPYIIDPKIKVRL